MSRSQCTNCAFSSWYNKFKDITLKSRVVKLPTEFVAYLKEDGVVLPDREETRYSNELDGYSDEEGDWDDVNNVEVDSLPCFPALKKKVEEAISALGGSVFPKLNWSAPKDACWITVDGTLRCSTFNDICLLLKSSDFVSHDLTKAYSYCADDPKPLADDSFELVLRRWHDLIPGMEFRVFVRSNTLVGISQRHTSSYFSYLAPQKTAILNGIIKLFEQKIKNVFADESFVFDVVNINDSMKLLDFNPFLEKTDSLLFSWSQLKSGETCCEQPDFRIITSSDGIQPNPLSAFSVPKDIVDLRRGEDIHKMIDLLKVNDLIARPNQN